MIFILMNQNKNLRDIYHLCKKKRRKFLIKILNLNDILYFLRIICC